MMVTHAAAEPMHFEAIRNGGNCAGCAYTQASGEITLDTAKNFEAFVRSQEFGTGPIRLNSLGGSLGGGILLGELFRSMGVPTEVGSSAPIDNSTELGLRIGHQRFVHPLARTPFWGEQTGRLMTTRGSVFIDSTKRTP
jgi:hypothetical protein